ncbi:hypothetical protein MH1LPH_22240 [Lactiplantibacillus brownii]
MFIESLFDVGVASTFAVSRPNFGCRFAPIANVLPTETGRLANLLIVSAMRHEPLRDSGLRGISNCARIKSNVSELIWTYDD